MVIRINSHPNNNSNSNSNSSNSSLIMETTVRSNFIWKAVAVLLIMGVFLVLSDSVDLQQAERTDVRVQKKEGRSGDGGGEGTDFHSDGSPQEEVAVVVAPSTTTTPTASPIPDQTTTTTTGSGSSYTYTPRGKPLTDEQRQALVDQWGSWTLVDSKRHTRPSNDFYLKYRNRDVPRSKFPSTAWQVDKEYLDHFLPQGLALVERAQEAILAEYGKTVGTLEERSDMFRLEVMDSWEGLTINRRHPPPATEKGGLTTHTSWEGFVRTVLHAVMTEDSFVFAMGGHSAAAGHGNHFLQSYTLQVQWILEAVFARLGVKHEARNFGMGGLGTGQAGLGAGYLYGQDVDMLMWDSSMTEGDEGSQDLLHRQYILGAKKVPILWSLAGNPIIHLHQSTGVYAGIPGGGKAGIPEATAVEDFDTTVWAARYVQCVNELYDICREHEYNGTCWIPRDDVTVDWSISREPGGRAKWHPGNKHHQLQGRVLAFTILSALKDALTMWNNTDGYALPDEAWHVTPHYDSVRSKLSEDTTGACHTQYGGVGLGWACVHPVQARTEFTPRAYPSLSNIRNLLREEQRTTLTTPDNVYEPPDIFLPFLHPPDGEIDVLNIVEMGTVFEPVNVPDYSSDVYKKPTFANPPKIPLGKGLGILAKSGDPFCDGSVNSWCGRGRGDPCPLLGHNDGRNAIVFDEYSGWMVFNLPDVTNGYIAIKYQSWHDADSVPATDGWNSMNNETQHRHLVPQEEITSHVRKINHRSHRDLTILPFCDEFEFEYAIDGRIVTLSLAEWQVRSKNVQRVVEILSLLEDPTYTGGEPREVEVAIRIKGCGRQKTFGLTHVYWS